MFRVCCCADADDVISNGSFRYVTVFPSRDYPTTRDFPRWPANLCVTPVPNHADAGLGVFNIGETIPADCLLGIYIGEISKVKVDGGQDYILEVAEQSDGDGTLWIDSENAGNWTRFLNTTSCAETANCLFLDREELITAYNLSPEEQRQFTKHEVYIVTAREVHSCEQLSVFYGDSYKLAMEGSEIDAVAQTKLPSLPTLTTTLEEVSVEDGNEDSEASLGEDEDEDEDEDEEEEEEEDEDEEDEDEEDEEEAARIVLSQLVSRHPSFVSDVLSQFFQNINEKMKQNFSDSAPDLTGQLVVRTIVESHPRIAVDLVTSLVLSEAADSEAEDSKAEDSKTEDSD